MSWSYGNGGRYPDPLTGGSEGSQKDGRGLAEGSMSFGFFHPFFFSFFRSFEE